ncbi:hypothetical protein Btru_045096 [Bulinus truncatus]|nr:hypothetical protein Btru_045096 [Bulinus truncatus]
MTPPLIARLVDSTSLAAYHDGENNTCSYGDRYLMASSDSVPTYSNKMNPWRRGQTCLSDALTVVGEFPDVSDRLLGQEFPPDKQCQFNYGSSSYDCKLKNSLKELCFIYCYKRFDIYCYGQAALTGTSCGCGRVCRQGDCVIDLSVPSGGQYRIKL